LASDGCVSAQGNDTKNQSDYRLSLSLSLSLSSIQSGKKKTRKVRHLPRKLLKVRLHRFSDNSILIWSASSFQFAFWVNRCVIVCASSLLDRYQKLLTRREKPKAKELAIPVLLGVR
jgi:hypothetical protein